LITLVGTSAHEAATAEMVALHDAGIVTALIGSDEQSVSFTVAPEQIEDAVRFLHARLFELETSR
jgi:aspartokinase